MSNLLEYQSSFVLLIFLKLFETDPRSYFYFDNKPLIKNIFITKSLKAYKNIFITKSLKAYNSSCLYNFPNIEKHAIESCTLYLLTDTSPSENISVSYKKAYLTLAFIDTIHKNIFASDPSDVIEKYNHLSIEEFLNYIYLKFPTTLNKKLTSFSDFKVIFKSITGDDYAQFN